MNMGKKRKAQPLLAVRTVVQIPCSTLNRLWEWTEGGNVLHNGPFQMRKSILYILEPESEVISAISGVCREVVVRGFSDCVEERHVTFMRPLVDPVLRLCAMETSAPRPKLTFIDQCCDGA